MMKAKLSKDYKLSDKETLKKGKEYNVSTSLFKILQDGNYLKKGK
jgi:hypothetical protein